MRASGLPRRQIAITRASVTSSAVMGALIDQTEGQITKLKKRQMYGRGKLDLLQARVIGTG